MLHVEMSNMSDQVTLDRQSMCDEHTCNRNACKLCLNHTQARLGPKLPVFELRHTCECSRKCISLMFMHNDQTTYQTIHFKHNNNITWAKTVLENNSNQMGPTDRTTWVLSNSTLLVHKPATLQSCIPEKRGIG